MSRQLKIGIFFGVSFLILALFIFIVGNLSVLFRKSGYPLSVFFNSTAGLEKRAMVRMSGVKIGYVKDIRLVERKAKVDMLISPEILVPSGSKATLAALGLLGEKYIEIIPSDHPDFCQPGDSLEGLPPVSFDQLGTLLLSVGDEIKKTGEAIRLLFGEETKGSIGETLVSISSLTSELRDFLAENQGELNSGISRFSQAARGFDQKVGELAAGLEKTLALLQNIASENREKVKLNLEKITDVLEKTEESLKLIKESLEKINRGEGSLGKIIQNPVLYEKAEGVVTQIEKTIQPLSSWRLEGGFRWDYFGQDRSLKGSFSLGLRTSPSSFLQAQLVNDPWEDKFTSSLLWGLEWKKIQARFGILESEIGLGIDVEALPRLHFSFEAYDFNRSSQPHLRAFSQFALFKKAYFVLGVDDFSLASRRKAFFGLGWGLR